MVYLADGMDTNDPFIISALGWVHHVDWNRQPQWDHDDLPLPALDASGGDTLRERDDHSREFGIDSENLFIPFDTTGTVVHFDTRVPTEWEKSHLPVILLTGEDWNPSEEVLRPSTLTREEKEISNRGQG